MRILIDESLPPGFAQELADIDVSSLPNLDVLITRDRTAPLEQMAVLVLAGVRNRIDDLRLLTSQIRSILPYLQAGDVYEIRPLKGDVICDRAA